MQVVRITLLTRHLLLIAMISDGYVINISWAYIFFGLRVERLIPSITFNYNWHKRNFENVILGRGKILLPVEFKQPPAKHWRPWAVRTTTPRKTPTHFKLEFCVWLTGCVYHLLRRHKLTAAWRMRAALSSKWNLKQFVFGVSHLIPPKFWWFHVAGDGYEMYEYCSAVRSFV